MESHANKPQQWFYQNAFGLPAGPLTLLQLQAAIDRGELGESLRIRSEADAGWTSLNVIAAELGLRLPMAQMPRAIIMPKPARKTSLVTQLAALCLFSLLAFTGFKQWRERQLAEVTMLENARLSTEQEQQPVQLFRRALVPVREFRRLTYVVLDEKGRCPIIGQDTLKADKLITAELSSVEINQDSEGYCQIVGHLNPKHFPKIDDPRIEFQQRSKYDWNLETNVPGGWIEQADRFTNDQQERNSAVSQAEGARQRKISAATIAVAEQELLALTEFKTLVEQNWRTKTRCADTNDKGMKIPEYYANEHRKTVYFLRRPIAWSLRDSGRTKTKSSVVS